VIDERIGKLLFAGILGLAVAVPVNGYAQALEEVVVTARQREEAITDVPAAITAFTSQTIERAGIKRAEDFISLTPGVSIVNTAEVGDTQVSIRGINASRDAEASFAFIVDGILYTNPSAFNREFSNLAQIEVLKGPQGALYGRNASSGAIIVQTRKPGDELEGEIRGSAGRFETYTTSGYLAGPLIDNQLSGSISFDYRDTDGFFENEFLGQDDVVDRFENWNVYGRLIWEPTDRLSVDAKLRYGEVDAGAIVFNGSFFLNGFPASFDGNGNLNFGNPGDEGTFFQDVNKHDFRFVNNVPSENEQETTTFSIKFDYDMDWATATAWLLYSDIEQFFFADGTSGDFGFFTGTQGFNTFDATPDAIEQTCNDTANALANQGFQLNSPTILDNQFNVGLGDPLVGIPAAAAGATVFGPYTPTTCDGTQYQVRNQEDISFEVRLSSPGDQRLRWGVGFYFLDLEREVGVNLLPDTGDESRPKGLFVPGQTESLLHDRFDTTVYAVFGNFAYDIRPDLEFAAALRYDREERDVTNLVPVDARTNFVDLDPTVAGPFTGPFNGGSPLNPALVNFLPGGGVDPANPVRSGIADRAETFEEVQPKISLSWDATDSLTLYTSWGIGFKSGGFNNQGSSTFVNIFFNDSFITPMGGTPLNVDDVFKEEVSSSVEVGFKSSLLDGRLNLEGALYHTMVDDMQFFEFFVGTFGLLRVVTNIDEVSITGGELAGRLDMTDHWSVYGGLGVVNGVIEENQNRPQTVGNEVPYAPKFTANAGIEFFAPWVNDINVVGRADWNLVGETWFHTLQEDDVVPNVFTLAGFPGSNLSVTKRDTYKLINIRAGIETETWGISAFVNNLMDKRWLNEVIPAPEFGGAFVSPGTRRAWGFEAFYRF